MSLTSPYNSPAAGSHDTSLSRSCFPGRNWLTALVGAAALLTPACKPANDPSAANNNKPTPYSESWRKDELSLAQLQTKLTKLNRELSTFFLKSHPQAQALVEAINSSPVPFGNYVSEMYALVINSADKPNADFFLQTFTESPQALGNGIERTLETEIVKQLAAMPDLMRPFLAQIMASGSIFRENSGALTKFDEMALDYLALRIATHTLEVAAELKQNPARRPTNLNYYLTPSSHVTSPNFAYIDLASGINFDRYLPDIFISPTRRPVYLIDISPYVNHYWNSVSAALHLDNIHIVNCDIRALSKDSVPEKIGTIRLQNVAAWVSGLDTTWAHNITDLLAPGGQVIMVEPQVYLEKENLDQAQQLNSLQFSQRIAPDSRNNSLLLEFQGLATAHSDLFSIHYGHVDNNGQLSEGMTGYIIQATPQCKVRQVLDSVFILQKAHDK